MSHLGTPQFKLTWKISLQRFRLVPQKCYGCRCFQTSKWYQVPCCWKTMGGSSFNEGELPGFQTFLTSTSLGPGETLSLSLSLSLSIQGMSEISSCCWTWFLKKAEALCSDNSVMAPWGLPCPWSILGSSPAPRGRRVGEKESDVRLCLQPSHFYHETVMGVSQTSQWPRVDLYQDTHHETRLAANTCPMPREGD